MKLRKYTLSCVITSSACFIGHRRASGHLQDVHVLTQAWSLIVYHLRCCVELLVLFSSISLKTLIYVRLGKSMIKSMEAYLESPHYPCIAWLQHMCCVWRHGPEQYLIKR